MALLESRSFRDKFNALSHTQVLISWQTKTTQPTDKLLSLKLIDPEEVNFSNCDSDGPTKPVSRQEAGGGTSVKE